MQLVLVPNTRHAGSVAAASDLQAALRSLIGWRRSIRHLRVIAERAWLRIREDGYAFAKRTLDVLLSAFALIVLSPLLVLVAIAIKCTDRGPMFYKQLRVGREGRLFSFVKLRSMVCSADALRSQLADRNHHGDCVTFKIRDDPRITRIGRWIRKSSIDELPQLWCVLTGDMTLVGPRPPLPSEVAQYRAADRRRLAVTPGLTCIWQVSGRGDIPFPIQVRMDVDYIEQRSLWLDLKLLLLTIPAVLGRKGAY